MSNVRVAAFSISLDGFGAGPQQDLNNPLGDRGFELHSWFQSTKVFKNMHGQIGGTEGIDNDFAAQSFELESEVQNFGGEVVTLIGAAFARQQPCQSIALKISPAW
jgi:hypothetical protein